ncbi:zinc finger-containing ubiquitin peptidase 1 [Halyomorpha halys]|uniref:zinc finger-containing ubiquitin peptidase 1 n=1 Tax=Halyomorpha halys TaxID=286706 RepID=UPI000D0C7D9C|nr:zinc finger with UFM1-specific peptidase domain protein-like isoform X1 [Halyomorpha halys]
MFIKVNYYNTESSCDMAAKVPELSYSCEICGADGLSDEEMKIHVICHLKNAVVCPFCNSDNMTEDEMLTHVNTAHLDYLTPEQELLTFIDDGDELLSPLSESRWETKDRSNGMNNNNNNNNEFYNAQGKKLKNGDIPSWGSPQRSQLALNLRTNTAPAVPKTNLQYMFECPLCTYRGDTVSNLEEHINRQHFDLTSPSVNPDLASKHRSLYSCPLCVSTFENTPDLELHVNIEHKDVLSPAKPVHDITQDKISTECPICCMSNFKSTDELAYHIDQHFNPKGVSPLTPDVSCDRLLAKEMEKRDKEVQRLREQHEFELLRAQYGMDNEGNFKEQSLTNMQRAVYSGELSVADYYERQIELKMAESNGVDDGSSCTKDVVELIAAVSTSSSNVSRTLLCSKVDHYASTYGDRGWGCGYRNTQMMLSSLVHHTGYNEQLYKQWLLGRNPELPSRSAMPSISRLQEHIEWAWREGFDVQGADQLGGKLVNTRKWIGATEVVTVLSSLRIRCQLVDFHRPTSANGSHPEMFKWVLDYFQAYDDFKPPLYLQHQGHSRTIIGVEELRGGGENLIILDPSHSPAQMTGLRLTSTAQGVLGLLRKPLSAMKAKQYQVVAVAGIMDSEVEYQNSKVLRSVRVPPDRP